MLGRPETVSPRRLLSALWSCKGQLAVSRSVETRSAAESEEFPLGIGGCHLGRAFLSGGCFALATGVGEYRNGNAR